MLSNFQLKSWQHIIGVIEPQYDYNVCLHIGQHIILVDWIHQQHILWIEQYYVTVAVIVIFFIFQQSFSNLDHH